MDKQNTPTKYVRITKAEEFKWYSDKVGWVYPVEQETETHYRILSRDDDNKIGFTIQKYDCEPYEFPTLPTPEKIIGIDKAACCYAEMVEYIGSPRGGTWDLAEKDFKAGVEWVQKKIKAAPVQEGHTITTHQLQCLKQMVLDEHEHLVVAQLAEWFPTVFKKERTYKVGQRFELDGEPYLLCHSEGRNEVTLVCLNDGLLWAHAVRVNYVSEITEEEMKKLTDGSEIKLIE